MCARVPARPVVIIRSAVDARESVRDGVSRSRGLAHGPRLLSMRRMAGSVTRMNRRYLPPISDEFVSGRIKSWLLSSSTFASRPTSPAACQLFSGHVDELISVVLSRSFFLVSPSPRTSRATRRCERGGKADRFLPRLAGLSAPPRPHRPRNGGSATGGRLRGLAGPAAPLSGASRRQPTGPRTGAGCGDARPAAVATGQTVWGCCARRAGRAVTSAERLCRRRGGPGGRQKRGQRG